MNCKEYKKQIISYLDGELHQDMAHKVKEHLSHCESCNDTLAKLKNVYNLIELEKSEFHVDTFMSARVLAKISTKEKTFSTNSVSLRYLSIVSLAAAGIAIGILIGTLYSTNNSIDTSSTQVWDQLAEEYMPDIENNPYDLITIPNEIPTKP